MVHRWSIIDGPNMLYTVERLCVLLNLCTRPQHKNGTKKQEEFHKCVEGRLNNYLVVEAVELEDQKKLKD